MIYNYICFYTGGGNSEQLQQLTERICALEEGLRNINGSLQELGEWDVVLNHFKER